MAVIKFKFSPAKARAAVHWMVQSKPGIDLHAMLKACYFADKKHLNEFGRPIFGATYRAMRFGPVPLEVYEMAKGDPMWLSELGATRYPWEIRDGHRLVLSGNEAPDLSVLSTTDMEALDYGLKTSSSMTFSARTEATHGADWQAADLGIMRYEDMFEPNAPDRDERIAYLRETGRHLRL
jgi:hypothetical protein